MPVVLKPVKTTYWGEKFITFAQRSFEGGIHTAVPPNEVDQAKELVDCENMILAKDGILKTRPGTQLVSYVGYPIKGLGTYGGSLVWAANGKVYVDGNEVGECDTSGVVSFIEFGDKLCILDGGQLKVYDRNSYQTIETAPQGRYGLIRGNRLWIAGDPVNPNTLWYSAPFDLTDWGFSGLRLGGFFDVNPTSGSWISGIALFFDTILIFKDGNEKKIYRLDGTTQSNFTIRDIIGGTTCSSWRTPAFTQIGTVFYSQNGVFSFDGSQSVVVPISTKILDKINFTEPTKCIGILWGPESLYLLAYENTIYALNINVGAWFKWVFPYKITAMISGAGRNCYLGTEDGSIYRFDWDTYQDGTWSIRSVVKSPYYDFGDPAVIKYVKYLYIHLFPYGGGDIDVNFFTDFSYLRGPYEGRVVPTRVPFSLLTFEGGAGWDDPAIGWDDETVGWDIVVAIPLTVKLTLSARCRNIQIIISSEATPFALYGLELASAILRVA